MGFHRMLKSEILNDWFVGRHISGFADENTSRCRSMRPAAVLFLALALASAANYLLASWLGFSRTASGYIGIYRRVGPENGSQVFCAGSSLLVAALSWSKVSEALGQGIETWSVAGSSPEIWEVWQQQRPFSNTTIIGVSVYDLNEMHVAPERANVVPLSRTINDLRASHAGSAVSHRILTQYAFMYLRFLFPTAGTGEKVLIGLRGKVAQQLGREASLVKHGDVVVEPRPPLLSAGESTASFSDWSPGRLLRRIAALRADVSGEVFNGPKRRAFQRILLRAQRQGRVIVVVLPVSRAYSKAFLDESSKTAFDREIHEAMAMAPEAMLVRLDRVPGISENGNFFDLVHMNSFGRRVATRAFLMQLTHGGSQRRLDATSIASISSGK